MSDTALQFVSFSNDAWSRVWLNRHHVMSRIARQHPVLFVSQRARPSDLVANCFLHHLPHPGLRRVAPNLLDLVPTRFVPRLETPPLDAPLRSLHTAMVRRDARLLGTGERVLYLWHPDFEPMVGRLGERLVVFHCYDNYGGYHNLSAVQRRRLARAQTRLARRAGLVFASGNAMRELLPADVDVHVIPNGVDFESHERVRAEGSSVPNELERIPRPILAHVGRITPKIDFALLTEIARRRRDWSIVLVGPHESPLRPQDVPPYKTMLAEPNVHCVGFVPPDQMARYIQAMDVGLMAYRLAGWVIKGFPLKLFEYLAGGKPIVAPELEELQLYREYVRFATTPDEWVGAIAQALADTAEQKRHARITLAAQNSWDDRCRRILDLIEARLAGRGGGRT
ncbi:MAG: glycosyltransferase [Verrucomicrobia bacterium]|nr:glycosyltransferase [Verrucomicrobiota bacterium]